MSLLMLPLLAANACAEDLQPEQVGIETQSQPESAIDYLPLTATGSENRVFVLGPIEPENNPFKFELQLTTKGAALNSARLQGFSERGTSDVPLTFLSPIMDNRSNEILSLSNTYLTFEGIKGRFPLGKLNWIPGEIKYGDNGTEQLSFSAVLRTAEYGDVLKITKTYILLPDEQHFELYFTMKNLSDEAIKPIFEVQSAVGFEREGVRMDGRTIVAAFYNDNGTDNVKSTKLELIKVRRSEIDYINSGLSEKLEKSKIDAPKGSSKFSWIASGNKYFTCILKPTGEGYSVKPERAEYYDSKIVKGTPLKSQPKADGTEGIGYKLRFDNITLEPAGKTNSSKIIKTIVYLGPKEKAIFEKNPTYNKLHFMHAIDFKACCGNLFRPITFAILGFMNLCYNVIPNYGVIIIILVLLVRLALHPLTKKGQISMMKMGKLGPMVEQIKAKYSDDPKEMNARVMQLYKEQGASPMLGFLPMMIQMPIWVSLYSAIYASVDLRGAKFLPFWITDLSAPDMLISFNAFTIPLVNITLDSFNLLPILLTIAMFMQQKLMSTVNPATATPEVAQQQKMMQIMMPIMMLIFLYKAPSGLNLYIMASSFGGVIEQKVIRKHIKEQEEKEGNRVVIPASNNGGRQKKKKPKMY